MQSTAEVILSSTVAPDNLAACTQIETDLALAEWRAEMRAFEATQAAVEAAMNEQQQVPA